jgi:hypothetical protein
VILPSFSNLGFCCDKGSFRAVPDYPISAAPKWRKCLAFNPNYKLSKSPSPMKHLFVQVLVHFLVGLAPVSSDQKVPCSVHQRSRCEFGQSASPSCASPGQLIQIGRQTSFFRPHCAFLIWKPLNHRCFHILRPGHCLSSPTLTRHRSH